MSFTVLKHLVGEVKPPAPDPQRNLISADLDNCMMSAVKPVGGGIRTKQRCP